MNHWYHMDMNYRGLINMLIMCGCVGQTGGGWAHYVGQRKTAPADRLAALAFGLDWNRPPRQMNDLVLLRQLVQWRHEKNGYARRAAVAAGGQAAPPATCWTTTSRAERMG